MCNYASDIEDQTSKIIDATVELLWAHRDDVVNGKVHSKRARLYLALIKDACEVLLLSQSDRERLNAVCEVVKLAITAAADRENEVTVADVPAPSDSPNTTTLTV